MNISGLLERIKTALEYFKARFRSPSSKIPSQLSADDVHHEVKPAFVDLQGIAYQLVGEKSRHLFPLFEDLDLSLKRSGLKANFEAYVRLIAFCTILIASTTLVVVPSLLFFAFSVPLLPAFLFGIGSSLFSVAFTIIGFYGYPVYRADVKTRQLEDELPFTTGYMAILTSAGVSPENIFSSLSNLTVPMAITGDAKDVVRNVNLFGSDIVSALEEISKRTPSERFREMVEGFISAIHSGSNLAAYLREKSMQYMKLKRISLKKYSDTLSMLSEFYVAVLLTGPLMLIIMLTVMAMLGGGGLGIFSPDLLLSLLTYLGIPLGAVVFLIILDSTSPKW
jgi:flagellar protein FlaJ